MVSSGSDEPPRSSSRQLVGVGALCLVVGFLAGGRTDLLPRTSGADESSSAMLLTAGAVMKGAGGGSTDGDDFEVPLYNRSDEKFDVTVVDLDGWSSGLQSSTTAIPPATWGVVTFSAPADCSDPLRRDVRSVRLRLRTSSGVSDEELPLPGGGDELITYHEAWCAPGAPVRPKDLAGVWMLETVYGQWTSLEGLHLMRFDRDGTFVVDPEGGLFSGDRGVWGDYRLDGEVITLVTDGGYACGPGSEATARVSVRYENQLVLAWTGGNCPDGHREVWLARRVMRDVGLPERPPGVPPGAGTGAHSRP